MLSSSLFFIIIEGIAIAGARSTRRVARQKLLDGTGGYAAQVITQRAREKQMRGLQMGWALVFSGLCALLVAQPVETQVEGVQVFGVSSQTHRRLLELEARLQQPEAEVVEQLIRCLDEDGDLLINVDGRRHVSARYWIQVLLSRLPPALLEPYRLRIDPIAKSLVTTAQQRGTVKEWREVIEYYPLSRPARTAFLLYGDWLWERGEAAAALAIWEHLLPDSSAEWIHPDMRDQPDAELLAKVRARCILSAIVEGHTQQAWQLWSRFRQAFPQARGRLAGHEGNLSQLLEQLLKRPPAYHRPMVHPQQWCTFGGQPTRNPVVAQLPTVLAGRPSWQVELTGLSQPPPNADNVADLQYGVFPVAIDNTVFVTDGFRLHAWDLRSGEPVLDSDLPAVARPIFNVAVPCPMLSVDAQTIYVRSGMLRQRPGPAAKNPLLAGELLGLRWYRNNNNKGQGTIVPAWRLPPPHPDAFWQGAPLVVGRRMWAAYGRIDGGRLRHAVACYEPTDASDKPQLRWQTEVSSHPWLPSHEARPRCELLTWADERIIYNTNNGLVVALDAATGRRLWAFSYSRQTRSRGDLPLHPAPAIYDNGRVFVAPVDSSAVYALDVCQGRILWEWTGVQGAILHAATPSHLLVSVQRPQAGLAGIHLRTGSARPNDGGWFLPLREPMRAATFVSPQAFFYPARAGVLCLCPDQGLPAPRPVASLPLAHYLLVGGVLLSATPQRLCAYLPEHLRFPAQHSAAGAFWSVP
jgi:hypothetical protein